MPPVRRIKSDSTGRASVFWCIKGYTWSKGCNRNFILYAEGDGAERKVDERDVGGNARPQAE